MQEDSSARGHCQGVDAGQHLHRGKRCALLVLVARAGCNYRWAVRLLSSFVVADWWRSGAALLLLLPLLLLPLLLLLVMVMVVGVLLLLLLLLLLPVLASCAPWWC